MTLRTHAWKLVETARALDAAITRREDRRSVLIDSRTAMNYAMAAPIQAALAGDRRVQFFAISERARRRHRGNSPRGRCRARPCISPRRAALKRIDVYLTADLLWAALPRGARRIQMFHGVAGKFQHDYDRPESSMRRWHRFFFVNRRRMRNFISAGAIDCVERRAAPRRHAEGRLPGGRLAPARPHPDRSQSRSGAAHGALRANLVGGIVAEPDGNGARRAGCSNVRGTSSSSSTTARAIHAPFTPAASTGRPA